MYVTLAEMKAYVNESGSGYDTFLTEQIQLISDTIDKYCRQKIEQHTVVETFYGDDYGNGERKKLQLHGAPVISISEIKVNDVDVTTELEYRLDKIGGHLIGPRCELFSYCDELKVTYVAGYANVPTPLKDVTYSLVAERYNKKVSGIPLNFGSDVQRVSIPGTISIDFDYSLASNDRVTPFGVILGNYINVCDQYRSERVIVGNGKITYI